MASFGLIISAIGTGAIFNHRSLLHVAYGAEHHGGRTRDSARLLERCEGFASLALENFHKGFDSRDAATDVSLVTV